jgi:hypothetical protein
LSFLRRSAFADAGLRESAHARHDFFGQTGGGFTDEVFTVLVTDFKLSASWFHQP